MYPRLTQSVVVASLSAFALETYELAHKRDIGHALPSALQIATVASTTSTAAMVMTSFPSAITEAVYRNVPDSKVLKNDGQTLPITLP